MTRRSMKRMAVTAAVAMAVCAMSSPSGAGGIWGGGRRTTDARAASARTALDARAGWRVAETRAASERASDATRAGWRLVARAVAARAGW